MTWNSGVWGPITTGASSSIPTMSDCLDAARFYLGDAGAEVFTNTLLAQPFNMAYRELFRALQGLANPRVQRTVYYDLPAYTTFLSPGTANISDLIAVEVMEERGGVTSVEITAAVAGGNGVVITTASDHPFNTGDIAVIFGVGGMGGVNGAYGVTADDPVTFTLNGAVGEGSYTSGGTASKSGENFTEVIGPRRLVDIGGAASVLGVYDWYEDGFHFAVCSGLRELRITYLSSATTLAVDGPTGVGDSLDFLAIRTAALAAASRGARDRAAELNLMAIGPSGQADGSGGILRELVATGVRALQANPVQRPPFRQRWPADTTQYL